MGEVGPRSTIDEAVSSVDAAPLLRVASIREPAVLCERPERAERAERPVCCIPVDLERADAERCDMEGAETSERELGYNEPRPEPSP